MPAGQKQDFLKKPRNYLQCGMTSAGAKANKSLCRESAYLDLGREGYQEKVTGELDF